VSPSSPTVLAGGALTRSGDRLTVELHQPADTPAVVLLRWPAAASVVDPNPKSLAAVAASMVRILAEAQAKVAEIKSRRPR
jgi:hypothetical protein